METPTAQADAPRPLPDRSSERRRLLSMAAKAFAVGGAVAAQACSEGEESPLANMPTPTPTGTATPTPTPTTITAVNDTDMMVLMLQLHYLQAEYYSMAVLGAPLAAALVTGSGTPGDVTGPRQVTFADPILAELLREIATEKIDQIVRLRSVLGSSTPARPAINLGVDANGAFTVYGRNANEVVAPATYDVYASPERFLLGAFLLEDPVVMAWRGIATLMTSSTNIDIAAGLLATSAHHTGVIRSQLYTRGNVTGSTLRQSTIRLSDLRDGYTPTVDDDRGVAASAAITAAADVTPADGEGEVYGRLPNLTVNTFYMTRAAATSGGFFPAGLNGVIRQSAAH